MNAHNHLKTTISLCVALALGCFGPLPIARAVMPAPDGFYPPGNSNTAEGFNAMFSNPTGSYNTAVGLNALYTDTTGSRNTAIGVNALRYNVTGYSNTAVGVNALYANTASYNTALGASALFHNTGGAQNNAFGYNALQNNAIGNDNNAFGYYALVTNTSGSENSAFGSVALINNTGSANTAIGWGAGYDLTTGSGNVCIGANVYGVAGESNTTRIRNVYASLATGRAVYVDSDNKIGTLSSSRRYKEKIQPMDKASETLYRLKPVTYRFKKEIDSTQSLAFGLIAEDVAQVNPDLITRDQEGKPQTVRYEAVNAMPLNEFLKEHRMVQEQQKEIDALKKELKEQKALIQHVSACIELSKSSTQTALNHP